MFNFIKNKIKNVKTVSKLCVLAEEHAERDNQELPAAEHFLLAAIDLADGSAREAFTTAGANPDEFKDAVEAQYTAALSKVGIVQSSIQASSARETAQHSPKRKINYKASASGQELMQELANRRLDHKRLRGAHFVEVAASMRHGVIARALKAMDLDPQALEMAAREVNRRADSIDS